MAATSNKSMAMSPESMAERQKALGIIQDDHAVALAPLTVNLKVDDMAKAKAQSDYNHDELKAMQQAIRERKLQEAAAVKAKRDADALASRQGIFADGDRRTRDAPDQKVMAAQAVNYPQPVLSPQGVSSPQLVQSPQDQKSPPGANSKTQCCQLF